MPWVRSLTTICEKFSMNLWTFVRGNFKVSETFGSWVVNGATHMMTYLGMPKKPCIRLLIANTY